MYLTKRQVTEVYSLDINMFRTKKISKQRIRHDVLEFYCQAIIPPMNLGEFIKFKMKEYSTIE